MKNILVKSLPLAMLAVCFCFLGCGSDKSSGPDGNVGNTDFVAKASFSYGVEVTDHTRLRLEGINGNVDITALTEADSVIITGERRVGSESMQDAEAHLQELEVSVREVAGEVYVKTNQPDQTHGRSYVVDYNITLPKELEVVVINVNGAVDIDSVNGFVSVVNVNGQVDLDEIFGNVSVSLVNGQISAEVTPPLGGIISMATVNGGINLDIPQYTSAQFSVTVVNGTISISNLVLTGIVSTPTSLTGTLGTGEGTIALSTVNGSISVRGF
jgi:DUF4097 and DUF4098 domain-containing protein YvlB